MYFEQALHSKASALEVAEDAHSFMLAKLTTGYLKLVGLNGKDEEVTLFIRPALDQFRVLELDDSQCVKCIANDGREVTLVFPPIALRAVRPAGILIGIEPLPSAPKS